MEGKTESGKDYVELGKKGGASTLKKYGPDYYREIGAKGRANTSTEARHRRSVKAGRAKFQKYGREHMVEMARKSHVRNQDPGQQGVDTTRFYVIRLLGLVNGASSFFDGEYLKEYDPSPKGEDWLPTECLLTTTQNIDEAKKFGSFQEAKAEWQRVDERRPVRPYDGRPNRPLTVFTVEFLSFQEGIQDGASLPQGAVQTRAHCADRIAEDRPADTEENQNSGGHLNE